MCCTGVCKGRLHIPLLLQKPALPCPSGADSWQRRRSSNMEPLAELTSCLAKGTVDMMQLVGPHLVGHHHRHAKLVRQAGQAPQEAAQLHLAVGQLASPDVLRPAGRAWDRCTLCPSTNSTQRHVKPSPRGAAHTMQHNMKHERSVWHTGSMRHTCTALTDAKRDSYTRIHRPTPPPHPHLHTIEHKAHLYSAVAESTTMSAKRDSAIMLAASTSSFIWCSVLYARAYATLSRICCTSMPYLRRTCAREVQVVHAWAVWRAVQE